MKSSTFMKESTWILYSFDVKMDGKNACRLTDKKFQNHENTADLAVRSSFRLRNGSTIEDRLRTEEADKRQGKAWDDCMVEELCGMVTEFNGDRQRLN